MDGMWECCSKRPSVLCSVPTSFIRAGRRALDRIRSHRAIQGDLDAISNRSTGRLYALHAEYVTIAGGIGRSQNKNPRCHARLVVCRQRRESPARSGTSPERDTGELRRLIRLLLHGDQSVSVRGDRQYVTQSPVLGSAAAEGSRRIVNQVGTDRIPDSRAFPPERLCTCQSNQKHPRRRLFLAASGNRDSNCR